MSVSRKYYPPAIVRINKVGNVYNALVAYNVCLVSEGEVEVVTTGHANARAAALAFRSMQKQRAQRTRDLAVTKPRRIRQPVMEEPEEEALVKVQVPKAFVSNRSGIYIGRLTALVVLIATSLASGMAALRYLR